MKVLYFGIISEITGKEAEKLTGEYLNVNELIKDLSSRYKRLQNVLFQVSINQKVVPLTHPIAMEDEIAILPPFAGG
ncbi:MoaD/ThiS family protein [Putridiphycobacter roseus]|uniref:Molybdopterin synthase sulfur carrier subunit n=1 Tax=Putridiphycobacter roseus TaxID=2219161 RepID=A0A2W1NN43_9FLAO|nr:MoaD/ThiS family protein [Putridiphycobacter roseus]PZE17102.1 MoaD/ThiS family protein [Putridiphycobacter roseus]